MSVSPTNPLLIRRAAMRAFVAAGLCGVAWQVVAGPIHARLASASTEAASQQAEITAFNDSLNAMPVLPEQIIERATTRARRIEEISKEAGDASSLYDAIASIARNSGVRIERIEPRQTQQNARVSNKSGVESSSFGVEVTGNFASLASFVERVSSQIGLARVVGLQVRPTIIPDEDGKGALLAATVETTYFRLVQTLDERVKAASATPAAKKPTGKGGVP